MVVRVSTPARNKGPCVCRHWRPQRQPGRKCDGFAICGSSCRRYGSTRGRAAPAPSRRWATRRDGRRAESLVAQGLLAFQSFGEVISCRAPGVTGPRLFNARQKRLEFTIGHLMQIFGFGKGTAADVGCQGGGCCSRMVIAQAHSAAERLGHS